MSHIIQNSNNNLLIISEIGLELNVDNIEEDYKKLFSEKITNKDCILYNNTGDILSNLNEIFTTQQETQKFFLFNKKYDKELILKILDEYIQKLISNYDSQLILDKQNLPDIYSNEKLLIENSSKLKYIEANDIKITFEKMLEYFENYKNIYTSFKVNSHICEEIKNNYKNIILSVNILIDDINKISKICEQKKSETNNENKKLNEIKEINIKNLDEGLNNLKSQELHPKLQTGDQKFLIDIYFEEKDIELKKEEYLKQEEKIIKLTKERSAIYINETKKFIKIKEEAINEIQNEMNNISQEYDNGVNLLINEPNKIYERLMQDFLYFKHSLLIIFDFLNSNNVNGIEGNPNISSSQDLKAFDDSCEQINSLKNKYNDFSSLNQLQAKLEPINQIHLKMRKSFENLGIKVNKIFNNLFNIYSTIKELSDKFVQIKQKTINLEECFNQLQNPSKFPMAYKNSLEEIKRRIIFNHKIKKIFDIIENLVKDEIELRKDFKTRYGIYLPNLPNNFFSCLKNDEPKAKLEINTYDELNKFPQLITEEEINILLDNMNLDKNILNISYEGNSLNNDLKKIQELNEELNKKDNKIKNLESELEKTSILIENILKNSVIFLDEKDEEIRRISKEKNNIISYFNNRIKNNIQTCPLCKEVAYNNEPNPNIQLINNKISKMENIITQIEQRYKNLMINTLSIKKIFFNHMNNKIAEYNLNNLNNANINIGLFNSNNVLESSGNNLYYNELKANNIKYQVENNDIQIMTKLLNDEKSSNKKLIEEKNFLISKYNYLTSELKKLQNKNEQYIIQLKSLSEKINILQNENQSLKVELSKNEELMKNRDNTIFDLRQLIKQISEKNNLNENKQTKEIQKIKNKSIIFKDIKEGDRCIFVPYSEKIYVCINLTVDLNAINNDFFICDIILDFSCIDEDKKKLIIENNLILIGNISELKEIIIKEGEDNPFEVNEEEENEEDEFSVVSTSINSYLKATHCYHLARISNIDYIIGFPEDKLCFMNYNNYNTNYINHINKK